ncbi:MAG: amidinotransferase, partial [Actinomycetes bacterium]
MGERLFGVRSMVSPLRRVLVVRPTVTGDFAGAGWRTPEPATLLRQHAAFVELLSGLGVEVVL